MFFPPSARFFVPSLVLIFGLAVTWLDYRLNLASDLERNLADVQKQADATGLRLARLSAQLMASHETPLIERDLAGTAELPWLQSAALIDAGGRVLADSDGKWKGRNAAQTPLRAAAKLARVGSGASILRSEDKSQLYGAYPVASTGAWLLLVSDRTEAVAAARRDAHRQIQWIATAVACLCLVLVAVLHAGFTSRMARLVRSVRSFGEGRSDHIRPLRGGDEIAHLSTAIAAMAARVKAHEAERADLEREVLNASEGERRRIGHELHDGLGQRLTAASVATDALAAELGANGGPAAPRAAEIARQLREAIAETRQLSHGLAPLSLETGDLTDALAELCESLQRAGNVRAVFECADHVKLHDVAVVTHLFRLAQEAVSNTLKHADAHEIRLGLTRGDGELVLEIEDDGKGISGSGPRGGGIGLRIMRHRSQLLGGSLQILPSPAGGTLVRCRCPLYETPS